MAHTDSLWRFLDPAEHALGRRVVGGNHPIIAAHERGQGDRLRRRQGDIATKAVMYVAMLVPPAQMRPVRHLAFEHRPKGIGIDRAGETECAGAFPCPSARLLVRGVVLGVVAVPLEIIDILRR